VIKFFPAAYFVSQLLVGTPGRPLYLGQVDLIPDLDIVDGIKHIPFSNPGQVGLAVSFDF
jgi:hypothetical protein